MLSGYDITSTVYTFSNKPSGVTHTHTASGKTTRTEVYTYTYAHADRISKVRHSLGGTSITLYDATYDNFGRLLTKQYHGTSTNKLTYAYNLRSWLTGISGTCFTQNLYYNTGVGTAKYNGSISSMTWKSGNESTVRVMGNPKNIDLKRLEKFGKVVKLNERKLFNTKDALF